MFTVRRLMLVCRKWQLCSGSCAYFKQILAEVCGGSSLLVSTVDRSRRRQPTLSWDGPQWDPAPVSASAWDLLCYVHLLPTASKCENAVCQSDALLSELPGFRNSWSVFSGAVRGPCSLPPHSAPLCTKCAISATLLIALRTHLVLLTVFISSVQLTPTVRSPS